MNFIELGMMAFLFSKNSHRMNYHYYGE